MLALECRRGESLYERGVAKERSIAEGCLLCRGVRGELGVGIAKVCVKEW